MSANQGGILSVLDDRRINGRAAFFKGLGMGYDGSWATLVGGQPVTTDQEVGIYTDIGSVPQMGDWEGQAKFNELPAYSGALRNTEYLAGLLIQKADIRRDKIGRIQERIAQLGQRAATHWEKLISTLIVNSETDGSKTIDSKNDLTSQAYDGQAFFDTDHSFANSVYTTSQTNDLTSSDYASLNIGTSTAPTVSEAAAFITDMIGHFWTFKDDQGEPTNGDAKSFVVMVGTNQLYSPIQAAFGLQGLASGENSRAYGMVNSLGINVTVVLNPRLSAKTAKVYVFNADGMGDKAFILQEETPLALAEDAGSDFDKAVKIGVWGTRAAGYGNWQRGVLGTLS